MSIPGTVVRTRYHQRGCSFFILLEISWTIIFDSLWTGNSADYWAKDSGINTAGKPVKKELDSIRSKTKSLPALLGGEPSIKISEKDFERVMEMAQASGTLEKLNEAYDRDMDTMQRKIDNLAVQVKGLKNKISQLEAFIKIKDLVDEFKEFIRPKTVTEKLQMNKRRVADADKERQVVMPKKKHDLAI